jgi:3-oxoacyl-[acyl-carrier protein] reductase
VRFNGQVVLITGGATNIGRDAALAFAREGARVMIADYDVVAARPTLADLQDVTPECAWVRADLSREDDVIRMRDVTLATFGGRIDVLINNAGTGSTLAPLEDVTVEDWEAAIAGNSRQIFLTTKHVLPVMMEQKKGAIVSTASMQALVGGTQSLVVPPSKAGVIGLTRHVALYYGPHGIRANCVCPGHIYTPKTRPIFGPMHMEPMYPLRRLGETIDVVNAYMYLASDESAFVTGTTFLVDGGFLVP